MNKRNVIVLLLFIYNSKAFCQSISPGGVNGVFRWYVASNKNSIPSLRNIGMLNPTLLPINGKGISAASLNYNAALKVSELGNFSIDLKQLKNSFSLFTVYQTLDTAKENCIWHMNRNNKTSLVLTTDRAADLESYKYMNFTDIVRSNPKVNIYVQQKDDFGTQLAEFEWKIGAKPTSPSIPVNSFTGILPELIAFNRVLTTKERTQVASYLAIKYGITLTEPQAVYYNSNGQPIWEGSDYPSFHRNIAGIARDDSSGLMQQKRQAVIPPVCLLFRLSKYLLTTHSYFGVKMDYHLR